MEHSNSPASAENFFLAGKRPGGPAPSRAGAASVSNCFYYYY